MRQSFHWIMDCIESSTNGFQFDCCHTLIGLFKMKYKDELLVEKEADELSTALYNQKTKHNVEV